MDISIIQSAPTLVYMIANYVLDGGYPGDAERDPFYSFTGHYDTKYYDSMYSKLEKEINNVIDFARKWDIDENEWDFSSIDKKYVFAVGYLSIFFPDKRRYKEEGESIEEYAKSLVEMTEAEALAI